MMQTLQKADTIINENLSASINKKKNNFTYFFYYWWLNGCVKIFDRVGEDFVFSALQKFEHGEKFLHMIKVMFTSIQC